MKSTYGKVTSRTIKELSAIVGKNNILVEKNEVAGYADDESPMAKPHSPHVVVKPVDTASVAALMEFANQEKIPVTPRGAGTGLSGGCIPVYGGIVLSTEKLSRVLEVDAENFVAIVEPGVTLETLYNEVEQRGLYYPLYPGEKTATIGGNVATNAGGMNAVKYGVTRHNVLGLEAVLPNGKIITTGGKFVKCSTGYDLTQLIIGSEGTLAVVTKIILKLTTKPAYREVLFAPFENLSQAISAVPDVLRLKVIPTGIEFMERAVIEIAEKYLGRDIPYHQYEASLLIIMDGDSQNEIMEYFNKVEEICKQHGAVEAMVPGSERAKRRLLEAREIFYHAIKKYAPMELIDVVVPRSNIARFVKKIKDISGTYKIPIAVYGHAGDGNVHLHPICRGISEKEWNKVLPRLMDEIYCAGSSFGGAVSGEHGIGIEKKRFFNNEVDESIIGVMKGIKKAFDPNNILNPGKIFDL